MSIIKQLERLIDLTSPAQVALWLGYKDSRQLMMWIHRKEIPRARVAIVERLLAQKGETKNVRIIRRRAGKKEAAT